MFNSVSSIKFSFLVITLSLVSTVGQAQASDISFDANKAGFGQSEWIRPNQANLTGLLPNSVKQSKNPSQSDWIMPGKFEQSDLACGAPITPPMGKEQSVALDGEVSQTDIVSDSLTLQGLSSTATTSAAQKASDTPLSTNTVAQPPSMDELVGQLMAAPMMMAASAGLLGQTFGSHGPIAGFGFHGFGPGAPVAIVGPRLSGPAAAGYMVGRMINKTARRSVGGMRIHVRF